VRSFLPELIDFVWNRKINLGKIFDLTLPLEEVEEGYGAMDERRVIKALLQRQGCARRRQRGSDARSSSAKAFEPLLSFVISATTLR
jgi:hypothetical protein